MFKMSGFENIIQKSINTIKEYNLNRILLHKKYPQITK